MVGLLEPEQRIVQSLVIDIVMVLPLEETARTGALDASLNYASVADQVVFIGQHGRWRLLESFSMAVCRLLLLAPAPSEGRAQVNEATVTIRKPAALGGLATPVVTLARDVGWSQAQGAADKMHRDALAETPMTGAYRLNLAPSQRGTLPIDVALMVIAGSGVTAGGQVLQVGSRLPRNDSATALTAGPDGLVALLVGRSQSPALSGGV